MTPFLFIQDGRCLTLQLCETADGKFSWVLLAADCGESRFGAHRVVAHSAALTWAPEAKTAAMAALLLNHRQGAGDTPAQPSPLAIPAKAEPVTPPPRLAPTARELIENIQALTDALALLQARLEYALTPPQSKAGQSTHGGRPLDASRTWRLCARQFTLIASGGLAVELSALEHRLMLALFCASGDPITSFPARIVAFWGLELVHSSKGALLVLVARFRAKFRHRGIDLPLHTARGTGYYFGAEVVIDED